MFNSNQIGYPDDKARNIPGKVKATWQENTALC